MATTELSPAVQRVRAILDRVYSPCAPSHGGDWKPRAFRSSAANHRYLWSDAFGVCNYLTLYYCTPHRQERHTYLAQADALISDVHDQLGRFRDSRTRLSPLASDEEPTRGGLRIGKPREEDDGQYLHYLTKWMFALNRMGVARQDAKYNRWAVQLAETAHARFVVRDERDGRPVRLVWKMAVDLQRVEVASEGNLDVMDALVTYRLLQRHSDRAQVSTDEKADARAQPPLQTEIAELELLVQRKMASFATSDELDAGEALWLAQWAQGLFPGEPWAARLERMALRSIERLFRTGTRFRGPARQRLLHREMAAVLGLQCGVLRYPRGGGAGDTERQMWRQRVDELLGFWDERLYERDASMSPLMFASALLPGVWNPWEQRG